MGKKKTMTVVTVILCLLLVTQMLVQPVAAAAAMPLFNNVASVSNPVTISDSGKLTVTNQYYGFEGTTTKAVITTYIEKKTLGLFWTRIDIGQTDNQWVDTLYGYKNSVAHSFQLDSTGTYRVVTTFVIYGTDGSSDEIEKIIEKIY